ncbi:MAG: hypothetical protein WCR52_22280 [Bacteroidota bacterium]
MAYESKEFLINQNLGNYNEFQSAATIFNNNLIVMTSWGENNGIDLVQTTFPLTDLIAHNPADPTEPINDHALKSSSKWSSTDILKNTNSAKPALAALPAANPDTLFSFFSSGGSRFPYNGGLLGILGIRFPLNDEDSSNNNQWSQPITLLAADGINKPLPTDRRDIYTTVLGDNIVLVSCASAQSVTKDTNALGNFSTTVPNVSGTFFGVYDKTKIDFENNVWTAEHSEYILFSDNFRSDNINGVLMEWFTKISVQGTLEYHLMLVRLTDSDHDFRISPMTINDKGVTGFNFIQLGVDTPGLKPATLNRDPTGRLRSWATRAGDHTEFMAYNVEYDGASLSLAATSNIIAASEVSGNSVNPSAALIYIATDGQYDGSIPATKPGLPDLKTNNYPVYEFVFYGEYPKCQVKRLATIQTVTDPEDNQRIVNLQPSKDNPTPVYIAGGIMNGPIPFPLENYKSFNPGDSDVSAGTLTYGTDSSTITGRKVEKSLSIGFEEEFKTTKGIGPAYKISFHAGMGSVNENTTEFEIVKNLTQKADITFDTGQLNNPVCETLGGVKKLSATMQITAYSYLDNYGPSIISTGPNQSKSGMGGGSIQIGYKDDGDFLTFEPFDVTRGDLASYMPQAINKRMVEEYGYKGSKYGYNGDNYFGDVICQNALPMGDMDYLEMVWDKSLQSTQSFTEIKTSFQESNWKYDGSVYAGVSGGAGFELFGIGEEIEASFLIGADISRDYSVSQETETKWGIEISEEWGPKEPGQNAGPKSVEHYVFRIYFLPAPTSPSILPANHWIQELFDYLPAGNDLTPQLDKNSACWKIVYVVTEIQYKDGTILRYPEVGETSLDKHSVYRK